MRIGAAEAGAAREATKKSAAAQANAIDATRLGLTGHLPRDEAGEIARLSRALYPAGIADDQGCVRRRRVEACRSLGVVGARRKNGRGEQNDPCAVVREQPGGEGAFMVDAHL